MKQVFCFVAAAAMMAACTQVNDMNAGIGENETLVQFRVSGDFERPTFTRGELSADGSSMTDLWVFDFVDGECAQSLHLTPEDEGWGAPAMVMSLGEHNVCFVAARGDNPELNEEEMTIMWAIPKDAFWGETTLNVSQNTTPVSVTLDRIATKLRLLATDAVPANAAVVAATPETWYYGVNYFTGEPTGEQKKERTVTIPSSYAGTDGRLAISFFGISGSAEWTTDVVLSSRDAQGNVIGSATIVGAPFKANRATEYSGRLFTKDGQMDVSLNAAWADAYTGTW